MSAYNLSLWVILPMPSCATLTVPSRARVELTTLVNAHDLTLSQNPKNGRKCWRQVAWTPVLLS